MRRIAFLLSAVLVVSERLAPAGGGPPIVTVSTGLMLLRDDNFAPIDPRLRFLKFKSRTKLDPVGHQIFMPGPGSDGDPTPDGATGGGATLTVYNPASGESFTIALPADKWTRQGTPTPRTYRYADGSGAISRAFVRPYKVYIRGGGSGWGFTLDEASQGTIAVRLTLGTGVTWCAEAPGRYPPSLNDIQDKFRSVKAGAPGACPPLHRP